MTAKEKKKTFRAQGKSLEEVGHKKNARGYPLRYACYFCGHMRAAKDLMEQKESQWTTRFIKVCKPRCNKEIE